MKSSKLHTAMTYLLRPLSWLYGGVTGIRNWMFDHGILSQTEFSVPVVSVGNLTIGGSGKTPHVEYIVRMLALDYKMAILSRGYKRKTKGFVLANSHSTPETIGDESLQIYRKYGSKVKVAVCENRRKGITRLMKQFPDLQLIVLDDAFQHRYVKPKVSILLTDYSRPIYEDKLLPLGRLRESQHNVERADVVIVTKCPSDIPPLEYRLMMKKLDLMSFQKLYFSGYSNGPLQPVFPDDEPYHISLGSLTAKDSVLLLTGIANPRYILKYLRQYPFRVRVCHFPDHHNYTREDLENIEKKFNVLTGERKIILTTEKDAVRLMYNPYFPSGLKQIIYYLPVEVKMADGIEDTDFISDLKKMIDSTASIAELSNRTYDPAN